MTSYLNIALAALTVSACATTAADDPELEPEQAELADGLTKPFILFRGNSANGGADVHHSYRIPAIVSAGNGRLIAVAEGRVDNANDYGNINLVMRRSTDNGVTWSKQELIWNAPDRLGTIGNPTLVYDPAKSRVWLFASENDSKHALGGAGKLLPIGVGDRRTWVRYTDPDKWVAGSTANIWSTPVNVTSSVTPRDYTWDAMGPGVGIVTTKGAKAGRIVIPAKGRIIISDDHGASWSSLATGGAPLNETTVAELASGWLYVNARSQGDEHRRQTKISKDDGVTWSAWATDAALTEAPVEASVLRYNMTDPARLMFFNPTKTSSRDIMEIRISYDDGATWPIRRVVDAGQGGYSSMTKTSDAHIAAMYESGVGSDSFQDIKFTRFNLSWMLNGKPEPKRAGWDQVVRADLDGNGDDELGFYAASTGTFAWYPMTTDGQLGTRLSSATIGSNWTSVLGFDPDGDGAESLAFYDAKAGSFEVHAASVAGVLGAQKSATTLSTGWTSVVATDFDGDGRDELVFYNATSGAFAVYATAVDGTLGARLTALTLGTGWTSVAAFAVGDDGRPALAFYNATSGGYAVYATTTAGALATRLSTATLAKGWTAIAPVQAVGSGRTQLAFYNRTSAGFAIYAVDATGQLGTQLSSFPLE